MTTSTVIVNYANAVKLAAATFDGVSDRLLHLAAATSVAYLAGVNAWNADKKVPAETVREQLVSAFMGENKRSTAYSFASTGFKLAARLSKGDKAFRETLKASDLGEAVGMVVAQIKADLKAANLPLTMDGLRDLLDGKKKDAKPKASVAERIVKALENPENEFTPDELRQILAAVRGRIGSVEQTDEQRAAA